RPRRQHRRRGEHRFLDQREYLARGGLLCAHRDGGGRPDEPVPTRLLGATHGTLMASCLVFWVCRNKLFFYEDPRGAPLCHEPNCTPVLEVDVERLRV